MKEAFTNKMKFFAVSAASTGVAVGIVAKMSEEKSRGPDRVHVGSCGNVPRWDNKQIPKNAGKAFGPGVGYFYPSPFGGVQGKTFPEEPKSSPGKHM